MAHMTQTPYGIVDAFNTTNQGEDGAIIQEFN